MKSSFLKLAVMMLVISYAPSAFAVKKFMSNKLNLVQVMSDAKNQIFPNQKFAKDIIQTVELQIKTGGSAVDQIVSLLEEIQTDLLNQQQDMDAAYNQKMVTLNQEIDDLTGSINSLQAQIAEDVQNIVLWGTQIEEDNAKIASLNSQIDALQKIQQDCINSRATDAAAYQQRQADQSAALGGINTILAALQEALDQKMAGIQITQTQLVEILQKSTKAQVLAKPMQAFVDLSLSFSPDQIQDLMAKLQTIATSFQVSMQTDSESEADQINKYSNQLVKYGEMMGAYQLQVSDLSNDVSMLENQIANTQARVDNNSAELDIKNSLLDDTKQEKSNTEQKYNDDSVQIQSEIDTVVQVINIFQASTEVQAYDNS